MQNTIDLNAALKKLKSLLVEHNLSEPGNLASKVYATILFIPEGKVVTYQEIARVINTKGFRAIGQVLKRNPLPIIIPCHRVVCSNLSIGGYMGAKEGKFIEKKQALLSKEGVVFNKNYKLSDVKFLHFFI